MSRTVGEAGPPYTRLEAALGTAVEPALLERALTHRSYAYEHGGLPTNERLEFLGDAVLGLAVTDSLYRAHPDLAEGQLAKLRASVVNTRALAGVARELGLGRWLRLGRGEETTGGRDKNSILADTTEALLGAVYLDRGVEAALALVERLFGPLMHAAAQDGAALDWKTALQELSATRSLGRPRLPPRRERSRPRQALPRRGARRRAGPRRRRGPEQEGGRAARGRGGLRRHLRRPAGR